MCDDSRTGGENKVSLNESPLTSSSGSGGPGGGEAGLMPIAMISRGCTTFAEGLKRDSSDGGIWRPKPRMVLGVWNDSLLWPGVNLWPAFSERLLASNGEGEALRSPPPGLALPCL